jgi:hypothetical protein
VGDKAIGTHLHDEEIPNSMLKVVIDENAQHFSDYWYCHANSSWVTSRCWVRNQPFYFKLSLQQITARLWTQNVPLASKSVHNRFQYLTAKYVDTAANR